YRVRHRAATFRRCEMLSDTPMENQHRPSFRRSMPFCDFSTYCREPHRLLISARSLTVAFPPVEVSCCLNQCDQIVTHCFYLLFDLRLSISQLLYFFRRSAFDEILI